MQAEVVDVAVCPRQVIGEAARDDRCKIGPEEGGHRTGNSHRPYNQRKPSRSRLRLHILARIAATPASISCTANSRQSTPTSRLHRTLPRQSTSTARLVSPGSGSL